MFWIFNIVIVFALCVLLAGIIIPQILLISFRKKLLDEPDERKIHKGAVPRLGGLAFLPVVFFSLVLIFGLNVNYQDSSLLQEIISKFPQFAFIACAVMMLYVVGMADDLIGIRYRAKFVVQIAASILMIMGGVWLFNWHGLLFVNQVSPWIGIPVTMLATIFIINSTNLIDGVDGLASGLSAIAFLTYGVVYYLAGQYIYALLSIALLGVLAPFFYYNVFGSAQKQKKIFMGDTGSLTIGLMLSYLSIGLVAIDPQTTIGDINIMVVAFSPLIIPCFDVVRVYGERIINKKNPFLPDKRHIHHKLMQLGMSTRRVMTSIVLISLSFTACNIIASIWVNINILLVVDVAIWVYVMLRVNKKIFEYKRKEINKNN